MSKSQERRQFIQMAGEFGVVAELFRRSVQATITYGNSKRADVFVISAAGNKAVKVEVKSSVLKRWIVDDRALDSQAHVFWVFVYLPRPSLTSSAAQIAEAGAASPRYHVLTSAEVKTIYEDKRAISQSRPTTFVYSDVQFKLNDWVKISDAIRRG